MTNQGEDKRTAPRCDSTLPDEEDHKPAKYIISICESESAANVAAVCDDCLRASVRGIMEGGYTAMISGV